MKGTDARTEPPKTRARSAAVRAWIVAAALVATAACGSSTTTVVSPSSTRCAISLTGGTSVAAGGGTGTVTVGAPRECTWTASSDAGWLTLTSGQSGQGDGTIQYSAAGNPAPAVRRGNVVVGEARVELTQAAAPCEFASRPASFTFEAAGGDGSIAIETLEGCRWTAASGAPWISIAGIPNPSGPGSVAFHVDANPGEPRTSTVVAAGQTIQISQGSAAAPCTYALDPASATLEALSGTARFNVAARSGCGWTAVSQVPWIEISGNATGNGNGSVGLVIAANTGAARSGSVTVQGQSFLVTQAAAAAPCTYSIAPTTASAAAAGGPTSVAVTTQARCTWTAASQASWIVVSSGSTGSGNGNVALTIAANTGGARSGTVSIAGRTFTVNQAAAAPTCTYSINPTSFNAPAAAATSAVEVTSQSGCAWTAVSQVPWITVPAGATGSGSGRVELAIAANSGGARSGSVSIGGRTFIVNQAAAPEPCSYTIAPTTFAAPEAGGPVAVDVTAADGCAWTAVSQAPWISVTAGASGTATGRVELSIGMNNGAARAGTVAIAGRLFTVNQAPAQASCVFTIAPLTLAAPEAGATAVVEVGSGEGCLWTAASQAPWIAVTAGGSGTGNGRVELAIAVNPGPARVGTVTIGNQTFTVNQQGVAPSHDAPPPSMSPRQSEIVDRLE